MSNHIDQRHMEPGDTCWAALLNGDTGSADLRATREESEADAAWLSSHPARKDRVLHGHGGAVDVVQLTVCEWSGEMIETHASREARRSGISIDEAKARLSAFYRARHAELQPPEAARPRDNRSPYAHLMRD